MDESLFQQLTQGAVAQQAAPAAPQQAPAQEDGSSLARQVVGGIADALNPVGHLAERVATGAEQLLGQDSSVAGAIRGYSDLQNTSTEAGVMGGMKSVFETKDFLWGDTPKTEMSDFRATIEGDSQRLSQESVVAGFSEAVGQFGVAMLGLGKLGAAAKAIPWVGRGLAGAQAAVESTAVGRGALEIGKAALAGAIAFDPYEERLSNLVQDTPLANPVTQWLAADPSDSAAEGRLKTALESIGMDLTIIGVLTGGGKILKALKKGDIEGAGRAADELEAKQQADIAAESRSSGQTAQPDGVRGDGSGPTSPTVPEGTTSGDAGGGEVGLPADGSPEASGKATVAEDPGAVVPGSASQQPVAPSILVTSEDTTGILAKIDDDVDAMESYGGWYKAIEAGHKFGDGEGIPYVKLNTDAQVDELRARLVDAKVEELDKLKGGAVLTDAEVDQTVQRMAKLTGDDPAALMGYIQQQGANANQAVATMEVAYGLSNKMLQDAWALGERMRLGDYTGYGSRGAMFEEVKKRLTLAIDSYGNARSMTASFGRGLRRMRKDFALDPNMFKDVNDEQLLDLLSASQADPRSLRQLANPSVWKQLGDFALYLRVNSLVSGPTTQLINVATSSYMVGARPLERMLGGAIRYAAGDTQSKTLILENARQYLYMGSALFDSFKMATKAFVKSDSVLSPHNTELWGKGQAVTGSSAMTLSRYRPWDSIENIAYNALNVAAVPIGLPTRTLGTVDELLKQTVYRSKVMARAHTEAALQLAGKSLSPADQRAYIDNYVKTRVANAFDDEGRGLDADALREANIATFQQDLNARTLGKGIQTFTTNFKPAKLVLPFVKTPTNVIRYGWKMTPGLNMLQGEYRDMLLGNMGREAQSQAMGQMATGTLFLGSAAYLASNGMITGGGPQDPRKKAELMATGWKPYSFVVENEDGSRSYVSFGRFDPVAVPFGIVADLQDAMHILEREDDPQVEEAIMALSIATAKQFTSKSYLMGVSQTMDAVMNAQDGRMQAAAGSMATSFIPYSAAMRQLNQDDYMREARSVADRVMASIPGLSKDLPAKYDWLGEPILSRNGLWSSDNGNLVDNEMQRLALGTSDSPTRPSPYLSGADLRDITMENGKNAYEEYQRLAGRPTPRSKPLRDVVARIIQSDTYERLPDGDASTRGTKMWMITGAVSKYRERAVQVLRKDASVRDALTKEELKVRQHFREVRGEDTPAQSVGPILDAFGAGSSNK